MCCASFYQEAWFLGKTNCRLSTRKDDNCTEIRKPMHTTMEYRKEIKARPNNRS